MAYKTNCFSNTARSFLSGPKWLTFAGIDGSAVLTSRTAPPEKLIFLVSPRSFKKQLCCSFHRSCQAQQTIPTVAGFPSHPCLALPMLTIYTSPREPTTPDRHTHGAHQPSLQYPTAKCSVVPPLLFSRCTRRAYLARRGSNTKFPSMRHIGRGCAETSQSARVVERCGISVSPHADIERN